MFPYLKAQLLQTYLAGEVSGESINSSSNNDGLILGRETTSVPMAVAGVATAISSAAVSKYCTMAGTGVTNGRSFRFLGNVSQAKFPYRLALSFIFTLENVRK